MAEMAFIGKSQGNRYLADTPIGPHQQPFRFKQAAACDVALQAFPAASLEIFPDIVAG